jgi:hypothetical protein
MILLVGVRLVWHIARRMPRAARFNPLRVDLAPASRSKRRPAMRKYALADIDLGASDDEPTNDS